MGWPNKSKFNTISFLDFLTMICFLPNSVLQNERNIHNLRYLFLAVILLNFLVFGYKICWIINTIETMMGVSKSLCTMVELLYAGYSNLINWYMVQLCNWYNQICHYTPALPSFLHCYWSLQLLSAWNDAIINNIMYMTLKITANQMSISFDLNIVNPPTHVNSFY